MLVLSTFIHMKFFHELITELIFREHTSHRFFKHLGGLHILQSGQSQVSWVLGVGVINLLILFCASNLDLVRIQNNDMVSGVHMWRKSRSVLSAQHISHTSCQTSKDFPFSIDHKPFSVLLLQCFWNRGFHKYSKIKRFQPGSLQHCHHHGNRPSLFAGVRSSWKRFQNVLQRLFEPVLCRDTVSPNESYSSCQSALPKKSNARTKKPKPFPWELWSSISRSKSERSQDCAS